MYIHTSPAQSGLVMALNMYICTYILWMSLYGTNWTLYTGDDCAQFSHAKVSRGLGSGKTIPVAIIMSGPVSAAIKGDGVPVLRRIFPSPE